MLQWHQHHRQFINIRLPGNPRIHINALLVMCSAAMVEGAISTLLLFYLNEPFSPFRSAITVHDPISLFNNRNREALIARVNTATWKDYKQLFAIVTGKELPELCGSTWEHISFLFDFRNLLFHGEQLRIKGSWVPSEGLDLRDVKRNKDKLFKYLEKREFIEAPKFGASIGWSFLSDEIADHFTEQSREFIAQIAKNAPDSDYEETFPKRMLEVLSRTDKPDASHDKPLYMAGNNA